VRTLAWIGLFGAAGVLLRHAVDQLLSPAAPGLPISTFAINVVGSLLAGFCYVLLGREQAELSTPVLVGFLGGFTTFSAYSLQCMRLFEDGRAGLALLYALASPALGLCSCLGGAWLARSLR
jgi:fluoride exporter